MAELCLLFDSDGTLVDSEVLLAEALASTLPGYGLPFMAAQYLDHFRGVRFRSIVAELEAHHGALAPERLDEMEARMRATLEDLMAARLTAMPGMPQALAELSGYPCGVVTNGPERKVRLALDTTGLARFFDGHIFSAYTLGVWKPDPRLYRLAAEQMGFAPQRCVVIDDAAVGVKAGLDAGMHVIHFAHHEDGLGTPSGALKMRSARELPALIREISQRVARLDP
ncbi:HAD-IA family hydrolase [Cobetia sp. 14N.309.X.WAT.E.A4]|uniref:HAD family hydrolase n=1 Tax=Cobetia sp. 14N.309.X.WAT.E.A4 TaxID=2998323 RepID=UPI0025B1C614|nr:HAD-IA family hydrolase [Cobetia sp. 14N.309.X.WAT.E.A4]MDN2656502.1 HAD-IA family hydrolase [Cobetia sp. 14N.309.X.WAT.E.A4]